jgi:hypothetical protein
VWKKLFPAFLLLLSGSISALAQTDKLTVVLKNERPLVVDEVFESRDGYWYKRGNVTTFLDRERVVRIDYPKPAEAASASEPSASEALQGTGKWRLADASKIHDFFQARFKRKTPLTAFGQSDLHTRWGWDHRNGMDVGIHPDSVEGRALIEFLRKESIPFVAFRGPVPGVATGPHIHIGNRSPRLSRR